jgi:steroid 5-alpha reductase family enzyme
MGDLLFTNAAAVFGGLTLVWLLSVILKRTDIIDVFWGPGFAVVAVTSLLQVDGDGPASLATTLLVGMVVLWALRLSSHLLIRWWGEAHEDRRYAEMRSHAPQTWWLRSLFTVFWLQAAILWLVSLPLQLAIQSASLRWPVVFAIGSGLWLVGFLFEGVGDWQLSRFRSDPANSDRVLNDGLWRYSRHPNYFGDFVLWWGFFAMSLALGAAWWTVISPAVMSVLLMKFSGVGLLEKNISSRRPGYREYVERTNTFFPWFPKSSSAQQSQ